MPISEPSLERLPVDGKSAGWPRVWATWFTEVWRQLTYNLHFPIRTITAAYTVTLSDAVILINGDLTVTLPAPGTCLDKKFTFKVINSGTGNRVIDGDGANIDGSGTKTVTTQYTSFDLVTDGTNWFVV